MKKRRKFPWDKLNSRYDFVLIRGEGERLKAHHVSSPAKIYVTRKFGPDAVVACTTVPDGVVVMLTYVPDPSNPVLDPPEPVQEEVETPLVEESEFDDENPDPDALEEDDVEWQ